MYQVLLNKYKYCQKVLDMQEQMQKMLFSVEQHVWEATRAIPKPTKSIAQYISIKIKFKSISNYVHFNIDDKNAKNKCNSI